MPPSYWDRPTVLIGVDPVPGQTKLVQKVRDPLVALNHCPVVLVSATANLEVV